MEGNSGSTIGEILRRERESRKQSLDDVHSATKISTEKIRALEEDDHGAFVSDAYLKGFLRTYANHLGIDAVALLGMLSRRRDSVASATWDVEKPLREERLTSPKIFRRVVVPVLIVIIALLVFLLVREQRRVRRLVPEVSIHRIDAGVMMVARRV